MRRAMTAGLMAALVVFTVSANDESIETAERYEVRSTLAAEDARSLAREMDARFRAYEQLFRFSPRALDRKLKVRAFGDQAAYDAYLMEKLGETRPEAVYLHYGRGDGADRSELVVLASGRTGRIFAHQAFIQYLRAYIPNPPAWIREGFAVYFEGLGYDAAKDELTYEENLAWLETVKGWGSAPPSLSSILLADAEGESGIDRMKLTGGSWALVSFLLNADAEEYRRTLYEAFMTLESAKSAAENARAVAERASDWLEEETALKDCVAYLASRKTFAELIEAGRAAYAAKEADRAELLFLNAADARPTHYAPHYYLGLLAYERKDYAIAENHYRTAEQLGADPALVNYALGINAAADGRKTDAVAFLEKAKASAPARYAAKVDELVARLK